MSPTGKEIINAFCKEGYFLLDLGESNLLPFRRLCEEFYEEALDTRLQVLACKESGILGYYPSYIESEKAIPPGKINHFQSERQRGYSSFDYVGEDSQLLNNSPLFKMNLWLNDSFRSKALANYTMLKEIGISILNSLCQELLEPHEQWNSEHLFSMMRLLLYSKVDLELISKEHTDYEFISIIVTDSEGLEVKSEDKWLQIPYNINQAIILPGDMLEVASGGRIRSVLHRVRCQGHSRRTTILFLGPPLNYWIDYLIDGEKITCTFKDHLLGLLLRGAEHLQEHVRLIAEEMNIEVPEKNIFKRKKNY